MERDTDALDFEGLRVLEWFVIRSFDTIYSEMKFLRIDRTILALLGRAPWLLSGFYLKESYINC